VNAGHRRPGYLYAFANDAWDYDNDRGSVQLTVTRLDGSGTPAEGSP